jgi:homoserine kinase
MKKITAFAPATVANFVCGYDILGFAIEGIGDEVSVSFNNKKENSFELLSDHEELKNLPPEKNVAFGMVQLLQQQTNNFEGVHITLNKKMPLNSGLGSSSASSVAALVAMNGLLGNPLSNAELLPFAMEGERMACGNAHADNVAPSLLGGIVLIKSYTPLEVVELPVPIHWYACVIHPHVDVPTKQARRILKNNVPLKDAVIQLGNVAGLMAGIYSGNDELVGRSMQDVLIEPHRAMLIPYFYEMKQKALELGAIGFGISGSGPSVFALCRNEVTAMAISAELQELLHLYKIEYDVFVSKVAKQGAYVMSE